MASESSATTIWHEGCPISGALKGNVEITVDATLEG